MPRILVVEDNESSRDMLTRRLERRGYEVTTAPDGAHGISMAREQPPDLIVMDMSLPEMDGWEATRRLKSAESTRAIPIVALTAHAMASDRKKAIDAGCDDFCTKPVDFEGLLRSIEAFLKANGIYQQGRNLVPVDLSQNLGRPAAVGDPQG